MACVDFISPRSCGAGARPPSFTGTLDQHLLRVLSRATIPSGPRLAGGDGAGIGKLTSPGPASVTRLNEPPTGARGTAERTTAAASNGTAKRKSRTLPKICHPPDGLPSLPTAAD